MFLPNSIQQIINILRKKCDIIEKLLDAKIDYVFKRIFGYKGNEDITAGLLSDILGKTVTNVVLNTNFNLEKDLLDDKLGILDIKAKLNNEINCDIEMQVVDKKNIEKRLLFYWSKMYSQSFKQGKDYSTLEKSIVILFSNYNLDNLKEIKKYITKWNIREEDYYQTILTDVLEIYIIELPKFGNTNIEKTNKTKKLDSWINFIRNQVVSVNEENEAIKKAQKVLEDISSSEDERRIAELRLKHIMDQKAIEDSGFDKGLKQGLIEGKIKLQKSIAKQMKADKVDIETICKYTGLTIEEIENL